MHHHAPAQQHQRSTASGCWTHSAPIRNHISCAVTSWITPRRSQAWHGQAIVRCGMRKNQTTCANADGACSLIPESVELAFVMPSLNINALHASAQRKNSCMDTLPWTSRKVILRSIQVKHMSSKGAHSSPTCQHVKASGPSVDPSNHLCAHRAATQHSAGSAHPMAALIRACMHRSRGDMRHPRSTANSYWTHSAPIRNHISCPVTSPKNHTKAWHG